MIRSLLLALALLQAAPATPTPSSFFRYQRLVRTQGAGQSCAILDAAVFAHAAPFLKDLRLLTSSGADAREIPYVLTLSEAQQAESEPARILNLGTRRNSIEFDLAMPARAYTDVVLNLAGQNFIANASVTGSSTPSARTGTRLGDFTLFDLSSQHLSRSSTLHLQESSFPFLHIRLTPRKANGGPLPPLPQIVRGATIPPSREAQTLFTPAVRATAFSQQGHDTTVQIALPERVPIERVTFTLQPGYSGNFSRDVQITSRSQEDPNLPGDSFTGTIERVKLTRAGQEISDLQLSVPATLGANLQSPATVTIAIHNGNDTPLPVASVQLEMRQRQLCFQNPTSASPMLFYGDAALPAPQYDFARTYTPTAQSATATLSPELLNPNWQPRPDDRPYTERHPHLLWIALLLVVCSLALVAFRSSRTSLH